MDLYDIQTKMYFSTTTRAGRVRWYSASAASNNACRIGYKIEPYLSNIEGMNVQWRPASVSYLSYGIFVCNSSGHE
jgi:hypothetical protein